MDEFDIIDFVYDAVDSANTGVTIYKDRSEIGVKGEHIVINNLSLNELELVNKMPININIFVPIGDNSSRMPRRSRLKEIKRAIRNSLNSINCKDGHYKHVDVIWSAPLSNLKDGFDCINIRLEVITE